MEFTESNQDWHRIPPWAEFLLRFGFGWLADAPRQRRIALVSMPCESAAAALIALGATRYRLTVDGANDLGSHFDRLKGLIDHPEGRVLIRKAGERAKYVVTGMYSPDILKVERINDPRATKLTVSRKQAPGWHLDDEPPVQVIPGNRLAYAEIYEGLVGNSAPINETNLQHSDSAICLAGRPVGEAPTRAAIAEVSFRANGSVADLSQLLSVHGWTADAVSRVCYFNSRSEKMDRGGVAPRLVVADGDIAFLRAIDNRLFRHSDIVGVTHRIAERASLEAVGEKLSSLSQWYREDTDTVWSGSVPPGISIVSLARN